VGAVYHFPTLRPPRSVAVFADGDDEGAVERAVLELAAA
jgi:hypothetical protein